MNVLDKKLEILRKKRLEYSFRLLWFKSKGVKSEEALWIMDIVSEVKKERRKWGAPARSQATCKPNIK